MELNETLSFLRQEYSTSIGSMVKDLILFLLYDAINDVCKAQVKAFHQFRKGIQHTLKSHQVTISQDIRKVGENMILNFQQLLH